MPNQREEDDPTDLGPVKIYDRPGTLAVPLWKWMAITASLITVSTAVWLIATYVV